MTILSHRINESYSLLTPTRFYKIEASLSGTTHESLSETTTSGNNFLLSIESKIGGIEYNDEPIKKINCSFSDLSEGIVYSFGENEISMTQISREKAKEILEEDPEFKDTIKTLHFNPAFKQRIEKIINDLFR